jgi:hypothetical protein
MQKDMALLTIIVIGTFVMGFMTGSFASYMLLKGSLNESQETSIQARP